MVPLHHLGLFVLFELGLCSYRTLVPTVYLTKFFATTFHFLACFSDNFLISSSVDFLWMSIMGRLVLNFLPFEILLGLLFTPGISVALNLSMASQASSAFFYHYLFYGLNHPFNATNRLVVVCTSFFNGYIEFYMEFIKFL